MLKCRRNMLLHESSKIGLFRTRTAAFTLAEVAMCVATAGVIFAGVLAGYVQSTRRAQYSEHAREALGFAKVIESGASTIKESGQQVIVASTVSGPAVSVAD